MNMLTLFRRHAKACPHCSKGRAWIKCSCPIWADGDVDGKEYRKSLRTRDWQRAIRLAERIECPARARSDLLPCAQPDCGARVEAGRCEKNRKLVPDAIDSFQKATADLSHGTKRNYARILRFFQEFNVRRGVRMVHEVDAALIYNFRSTRAISALTWTEELQVLRHFFRYCVDCEWTLRNPAKTVSMPRNLKPPDREPYTPLEVAKIIASCDVIGRGPYERLRARAMVLLMRYTGLRISDVALLARDRVRDGHIYLHTQKNGKPVFLPLHPDLVAALEMLPAPRGADGPECSNLFWSGNGTQRAMIRDATRTMAAVFKAAGVARACSHRFRHTLATEVLERGGTTAQVADILGDSEAVVRRHYLKWTTGRQASISEMMVRLWGTPGDKRGTQGNSRLEAQWNEWVTVPRHR